MATILAYAPALGPANFLLRASPHSARQPPDPSRQVVFEGVSQLRRRSSPIAFPSPPGYRPGPAKRACDVPYASRASIPCASRALNSLHTSNRTWETAPAVEFGVLHLAFTNSVSLMERHAHGAAFVLRESAVRLPSVPASTTIVRLWSKPQRRRCGGRTFFGVRINEGWLEEL